MDIDLELLREVFDAEADEHLRELEACLLALETHPGDARAVRDAFRAIHTLKGSASTVGYAATSELAHRVEDVLDRVRLVELVEVGATRRTGVRRRTRSRYEPTAVHLGYRRGVPAGRS